MAKPGVRVDPGKEIVFRLYVTEQKSLAEIARLYEVAPKSVSRWLQRAGISARGAREATMLSGKYGLQSEEHREKLRHNAEIARRHITAGSREKQSQKMKGRTPPNKGVPWSPELREKHMAIRSTSEYREKLSALQRGAKGHNWKGGASSSSLHGWEWRRRRREVYERDDWTCRDCGCKCLNDRDSRNDPKRKIQAHHIIRRRDGGNDEMDNLVTLCMSCHHRRERMFDGALFA